MTVEFDEPQVSNAYKQNGPKGFAKFVIEHSSGKIQNETQASIVLVLFSLLMVVSAVIFYHVNTPQKEPLVPAMPAATIN
ncbi:hypothetical protein BH11PAT3_BH11PAT3_2800 [soil metagenome]